MEGVFIESSMFSRLLPEYLDDEEYRMLQSLLLAQPESGDLIQGSGGLRKLRTGMKHRGKGKRGGLRLIYYWHKPANCFYMITLYAKAGLDDLTRKEIKTLQSLVNHWIKK